MATAPGYKVVTVLTTFPTAGLAVTAVAAASRLEVPDAGYNAIDFHVTLDGDRAGDYSLLRYWPDDLTWRMERPPVSFDATPGNRSIAPVGIPTGGGSFAIFRSATSGDGNESACMKAVTRR